MARFFYGYGKDLIRQASIQLAEDLFLVHVLAYEDELLHAVAVGLVPVAAKGWLTTHHILEFVLWHVGIPKSGIAQGDLFSGLVEDIAGVALVAEVADALAANHIGWHLAGHKLVELAQVERLTGIIHKGPYAIFLGLATLMVVMMVVMMLMFMFVIVVLVMVIVMVIVFIMNSFHLAYPSG